MRLLFLSTIYPTPAEPDKGPFNCNLVRALAARHQVSVVAPVPWPVARPWHPRAELADGVPVEYPRYVYPPKLGAWSGPFYWRSVRGAVERAATRLKPDVVVAYWAHPDGAAAVRAARRFGARSAVIVGGSDVMLLPRAGGRRKRVAGALAATDVVLTVSDSLRERVIDLGVGPAQVRVWRQGVDTDRFSPGDPAAARARLGLMPGPPLLVWVGRMVPVKGLEVLIAACSRLHHEGVEFRVALVGDGPLRQSLADAVKWVGLDGRVRFVGPCDQDRLADWYRAADLTVLPSRSEGLPNVLRESVCCDTPFVASRVGGVAEIADPALDRLVPAGDPAALAAAIAASLAARHCRPARSFHPLTWAESAEHLVELVSGRQYASLTLQDA